MKRHDIRGWRYGRLVAIAFHSIRRTPNGTGRTMWLCECDCGALCVVGIHSLMQGNNLTCGGPECRGGGGARRRRAWEALAAAMDALAPRLRQVLELTFIDGLTSRAAAGEMERVVETGGPPADRWSISYQRVNQLKAEALTKLRHALRRVEEQQEQIARSRELLAPPAAPRRNGRPRKPPPRVTSADRAATRAVLAERIAARKVARRSGAA